VWHKLVEMMRFNGLGAKANPLRARPAPEGSWLVETSFSPNPGNLRMFEYMPAGLKKGAPLVVILHGCGQTAAGYDQGAGWSQLANQMGFAVLAAEQKPANNPHTCFDWFNPEDIARDEGEAGSIAAMVTTMVEKHRLDARRVFITGLSAGGAMSAVMLALYPQMFAGGAIIAGLPFGSARDVRDALESMRSASLRTPAQWGELVRAASDHKGPWPRISIWHGGLDTTVNINNAQASMAQWAALHDLPLAAGKQDIVNGTIRLYWDDRLEVYTLPVFGHGTPIDSDDVGQPGPFILQAGISSSRRIAEFWGLAPISAAKPATLPSALPEIEHALMARQERTDISDRPRESLILRALKAAGLIKR
jgi:poly(hydroxyalkanoate) depolymerase family esterase